MNPTIGPRPGMRYRVTALAARIPNTVLNKRNRGSHFDAIEERRDKLRIVEHPLVPLQGETFEWKRHIDRIVEGEQRQEQHRKINEYQVDDGIYRETIEGKRLAGSGFHATFFLKWLVSQTNRQTAMVTASIAITERAAPIGQLSALPNCD